MDIHGLLNEACNGKYPNREQAQAQILTTVSQMLRDKDDAQMMLDDLIEKVSKLEAILRGLGLDPLDHLSEQELTDMREKLGNPIFVPFSPASRTILQIMSE